MAKRHRDWIETPQLLRKKFAGVRQFKITLFFGWVQSRIFRVIDDGVDARLAPVRCRIHKCGDELTVAPGFKKIGFLLVSAGEDGQDRSRRVLEKWVACGLSNQKIIIKVDGWSFLVRQKIERWCLGFTQWLEADSGNLILPKSQRLARFWIGCLGICIHI